MASSVLKHGILAPFGNCSVHSNDTRSSLKALNLKAVRLGSELRTGKLPFLGASYSINRLARFRPLACSSTSLAGSSGVERERLEKALEESLLAEEGNTSEGSLKLIEQLEAINPTLDSRTRPELVSGTFQMLSSNIPGLANGAVTSLGRLSFGSLRPSQLNVKIVRLLNPVGVETGYYHVDTEVEIQNKVTPPLRGVVSSKATIARGESANLWDITFLGSGLSPASGTNLDAWRDEFQADNPDMREDGAIEGALSQQKAAIKVTYLSDAMRITEGYQMVNGKIVFTGARVVMKRV